MSQTHWQYSLVTRPNIPRPCLRHFPIVLLTFPLPSFLFGSPPFSFLYSPDHFPCHGYHQLSPHYGDCISVAIKQTAHFVLLCMLKFNSSAIKARQVSNGAKSAYFSRQFGHDYGILHESCCAINVLIVLQNTSKGNNLYKMCQQPIAGLLHINVSCSDLASHNHIFLRY